MRRRNSAVTRTSGHWLRVGPTIAGAELGCEGGPAVPLAQSGRWRLRILTAAVGVAGTLLWLGPLLHGGRVTSVVSLPWWALFAACYVASLLYVQVRADRESSQLSLAEIPVVIGLFVIDPPLLLAAYAGSLLFAHWTRRRARLAQDCADAALAVLYIAVAVLVFAAIGPDAGDPLALRSVIAAACAMVAAGWLLAPLALAVASLQHERPLRRGELIRTLLLRTSVTATNTSLGIVTLLAARSRPLLVFAVVPPMIMVLFAAESRRRAARMEFLYHTADIIHSSADFSEFARSLFGTLGRMFSLPNGELIALPEPRAPGLHIRHDTRGGVAMSLSRLTFAEEETLDTLRPADVAHATSGLAGSPLGALLAERNAAHGFAVALPGGDRSHGLLLLYGPAGCRTRLTRRESELLLAVARQLAAALQHGRLADAVSAAKAQRAEPSRDDFYDTVTQIPNRALFVQRVGNALGKLPSTRRPVAAVCIDLDGFAKLSTAHGLEAGDRILNVVATRLRSQVRKVDMAARLGSDQFAILLDGMRHPNDAQVVARRVIESLRQPIPLGDEQVSISGSVGVAVAANPADASSAEELLRQADMALYLARRQGSDRYVIFDRGAREPLVAAPDNPAVAAAIIA